MQPRFAELQVDEAGFIGFLKVMFAQKRKTVSNNLKLAYDKAVAKAALARAEIAPTTRAEAISLPDMARLYRELKKVRAREGRCAAMSEVREAAVAGQFYPRSKTELLREVQGFLERGDEGRQAGAGARE